MEKTAAPAFTSSDVKSQMRPLNRLMGRMLAKKVDEPVDPTKKNETKPEAPAAGSESSSNGKSGDDTADKAVTTPTRRRRVARMNCKLNACMRCRTHCSPL